MSGKKRHKKKKDGGKGTAKGSQKHLRKEARAAKATKDAKAAKAAKGRSGKSAEAVAAPLSKKERKKLLKGRHCTGCKKACPLKDPKCKKGRVQADAFLESLLGPSLKSK